MNDRQALIEFTDATGVGIYQGPYAGCCGDPDCGYWDRRPQATRPIEPAPRWTLVGSRVLIALAAACGSWIVIAAVMWLGKVLGG